MFWVDNYVMDPELFKRRLEQFAKLKQVKTPRSPNIRESDEPEVIERHGGSMTIDSDNNPTLTWAIEKLNPHVALCNGCDQIVENRLVEIRQYQMPQPHWRQNCKTCMKTQNPYTGKFDLPSTKVFHAVSCWLKGMPEPQTYDTEKNSDLKPHFKKPAK